MSDSVVPVERVERTILLIRGQKVVLDADLASLYGIPTRTLNQAVKRNRDRFPADFMFQLTREEGDLLRSQIVISKGRGGRRTLPYAFTEHGVLMAANVLNSRRAVDVSIIIVRAFVRLRQLLATHAELARKLDELEARYDSQFRAVFDAIRALMAEPKERKKSPVGYLTEQTRPAKQAKKSRK